MPNLRLDSLTLQNFRGFEQLQISFHERLTVLVAHNGGGKSAVLDAAAVALGPFVGAFDEARGAQFLPTDIRRTRVRKTGSREMEAASTGTALKATGYVPLVNGYAGTDPNHREWQRYLRGLKNHTTIKEAQMLVDYGKQLQTQVRTVQGPNISGTVLPLVAYYGTDRLWGSNRITRSKLERSSRTIAYKDCLNPGASYKLFSQWFAYWSEAAFTLNHRAAKRGEEAVPTEFDEYLMSVCDAINRCLQGTGWEGLDYDPSLKELVSSHPNHGTLPVSMLSDGIRNMIGLAGDIAFRATKLNGNLGPMAAEQTPGIVLIDEIDMHLHPQWQQTVLPDLLAAFPNMQFIVTTHSPQVLTTVQDECIRILRDGAVFAAPAGTEGAESWRVLKRVMEVDPRPVKAEAAIQLKEYLTLVYQDKWASNRALKLRQLLDEHFKGEEPELQQADLHIENRKWELEG